MKIGVKTYDNEDFLRHFQNKCDFFEIQAIQKNNYDFLKNFKKPIIIHAEHQGFGINNTDSKLKNKNLKSINFARKLADKTNAKKIVMHPGRIVNKNCSKETAIKFAKNLDDKRIVIENITDMKTALCKTPKEMKEFMKLTGKGFCLDFNHAISVANKLGKNQIKFIKEFIKLKPTHFHLGGQKTWNFLNLIKGDETHLQLSESNIDLKKIVKLIPKNATVTLETTIDKYKTESDLKIMKKLGWKSKQN
ncbi:hypothetical protein HOD75_03935 [archaeon]|jgi:deoxyribonuclease IV|nr:hypothetical protein [archaeon]MBT4242019.1 hypothetical protein [archaeon]MBT4418566.1 hypothetical protein [archaeon]